MPGRIVYNEKTLRSHASTGHVRSFEREPHMIRFSPRRHLTVGGFTLVELLVVIGIIALLISILLPTLNKARESAKRAACLSNLRQVQQAIAIYANQYKDHVPLGYQDSGYQMNYDVCVSKSLIMFGYLYQAKLMAIPQAYFCPSEQSY